MAINITQLRAFHRVALDNGFSKAAQSLNVSQPTLSSQVKALEDRYGVHLFDRQGRIIRLTQSGRDLFAICQRIFGATAEAEDLLQGLTDLRAGEIRLASDSPIHAVQLIAAFKQRYPAPHIELFTGNNEAVLDHLESSRTDMAILAGKPPGKGYDHLRIARFPLVALIPHDHPWAARRELPLEALVRQPVLMREVGSITRTTFEEAVAQAGYELRHPIELGSREALKEGVAANLGIAVMSQAEYGADARMTAAVIADPRIIMEQHLVWPKSRGKMRIVQAMIRTAREMTKS